MLVIANGAPKSGSTWLYNIVSEMKKFAAVLPALVLDTKNVHPEIKYDKLAQVLRDLDYRSNDYLIKNHFGKPEQRDLILAHPDVFVLDIDRSLKDVVVSAFYYNEKLKRPGESFQKYYWTEGRDFADFVRCYHETWSKAPRDRALLVSYEALKNSFVAEVRRIGAFLKLPLSDEQIERIHRATSMEKLREKYDDEGEIKFFRKGVVGDWVNHFDDQMLRDVMAIEQDGIGGLGFVRKNYGRTKKRLYLLGRLAQVGATTFSSAPLAGSAGLGRRRTSPGTTLPRRGFQRVAQVPRRYPLLMRTKRGEA